MPLPTNAVIPMTNNILVILDPITFPATISELPMFTAAIDEANSGKDVPNATTVTPMINGEMPKDKPIFSAASTNQSLAFINTNKLITNIPIN